MQKKKDVDNDIVKLKLFPFSLRDCAKAWFSSLPKNSIDSWNECKDAFISKYFPPAKIISLRNDIMNCYCPTKLYAWRPNTRLQE